MGAALDELLTYAFTDPTAVLAEVGERLPSATPPERCQLLRALGNACRELRRTSDAATHHEAAYELSRVLGDRRLEGLSAMSLSATLTYAGEFDRALLLVDESIDLLVGDERLIALSQRAGMLSLAGRHHDATKAFDLAFESLDDTSDPSIVGDIWMNRGVLHGVLGELDAAEGDTQRALDMFETYGWDKRAADMQHNLAWLAGRRGNIVEALRRFDLAEASYEQAGVPALAIFPDRCETLLAAGLASEALALAERSAASLGERGDQVDRAESLLLVARAAILAGETARASSAAQEAASLFGAQHRESWSFAADSLVLESRLLAGCSAEPDLHKAMAIAESAATAGLYEVSIDARLLAADIATSVGDWPANEAAIGALDGKPLGLVARFRLELLRSQAVAARGDEAQAIATCIAALDNFADLAAALGGTELRASVAVHANRLAAFGLKLALDREDPATVLEWAERHRASALAFPPVLPPEDPELERELNDLRTALVAFDESARAGRVDPAAQSRVARSQDRVRRRVRRMPGELARNSTTLAPVAELTQTDAMWAVFVQSERRQWVIYANGSNVELVDLGDVTEIERAAANVHGSVSLYLRASARGIERDRASILSAAAHLDALLFVGFDRGPDRVVICPVGTAYDLPWGLLPTLRDLPFVVTPSITAYLRCQGIERLEPRRIVAVAGPRLGLADEEVHQVIDAYGSGEVLTGSDADALRVRQAIAGADIAHIACHGRFVFESPMFSSIELHGGPMFVHEFERLRPCPRITVLSACHAGVHTSPAEREIIGLSASLVAAGARSVVAATFAVPDSVATVAMMRAVHERLAAGADAATALCAARELDPLLGGAFVCHGASWE